VIASLGLNALVLITQLFLYSSYSNLSKKPVPTLVQLSSGEAIATTTLGNQERSPVVITKFVSNTITMLMNWSGTIPGSTEGSQPIPDAGVDIQSGNVRSKVTTPTFQAAFALSEDFRKEFLGELGKLTPKSIFSGTVKVAFVPWKFSSQFRLSQGNGVWF
jgi:hypothetical protein